MQLIESCMELHPVCCSVMLPIASFLIDDRSWPFWRTLDFSSERTMGCSASGHAGWPMQTPSAMYASSSRRIPDVRVA